MLFAASLCLFLVAPAALRSKGESGSVPWPQQSSDRQGHSEMVPFVCLARVLCFWWVLGNDWSSIQSINVWYRPP